MARNYAVVSPRFWTGETGKKIKGLGAETQVIALYLLSCPGANMIGLYYLPLPTLAHETGCPIDRATSGLLALHNIGFAHYDDQEEVVWVPEMAKYQIATDLKPSDKRCVAILNEAKRYEKSGFYAAFVRKYGKRFHLPLVDAPPKAHRSPIEEATDSILQDQDQNQDHDQEQGGKGIAPGSEPAKTTKQPPVELTPAGEIITDGDTHSMQYASRLLEAIGLPCSKSNNRIVTAAIDSLVAGGESRTAAFDFLLAQAKDAIDQGVKVNRFWFEDANYMRNGNGRQTTRSQERSATRRSNIAAGIAAAFSHS